MRFLLFKKYADSSYMRAKTKFLGELDNTFLKDFSTAKPLISKTVRNNRGEFIVVGVDELHDFYIIYYFPDGIYNGAEYAMITKSTLQAIEEVMRKTEEILGGE